MIEVKGGFMIMNKFLVLTVFVGLFLVSFASAYQTSTYLQGRGDGTAMLSTEHDVSATQSARLYAPNITDGVGGPYHEGRVRIEFPNNDLLLDSFDSLSWNQFVSNGYMAHVDVFIDTTGGDSSDQVIVFEGAKSTAFGELCDVTPYPTGDLVTFGSGRGEAITDTTYAWLNGPVPGPCGNGAFENVHKTLLEWKAEYPSASIVAFEFEVDGWVADFDYSEAFIDDITLNNEVIEDFEGTQGAEGEVLTDFTFIPTPNPLSFGGVFPGQSKTVTSALSVGMSNLEIGGVTIQEVSGSVFREDNLRFSQDDGANFYEWNTLPPFVINAQGSENLLVKLTIPPGTDEESFEGRIVYSVGVPL